MRRLLFAAHDPGGINVLSPVIEHFAGLPGCELVLALLGPARERFQSVRPDLRMAQLPTRPTPGYPNEQSTEASAIAALMEDPPDAVITATSFNSNLERLVIALAREKRVPSATILDFWSGYVSRFALGSRVAYPDLIFVADRKMARELLETDPASEVIISGNPHLQKLARGCLPRKSAFPLKFRFFSENIWHYYPERTINEFIIVTNLVRFLATQPRECKFLIRPHPMESQEPWLAFLDNVSAQGELNNINLSIDRDPFPVALRDSFRAIGLTTMALLETATCGIPTFSYQIQLPPEEYLFLPYEEYGIVQLKQHNDLQKLLMIPDEEGKNRDAPSISALEIIECALVKRTITRGENTSDHR